MSNVCRFQLQKREDLLLFFVILIVKYESLGFGQEKELEDVTLDCGKTLMSIFHVSF